MPSSVFTPHNRSSSTSSSATRPCRSVTFGCLAYRHSASTISTALSDSGKTRLPRSIFSGTPCSSKKSIVSDGIKREKAPYKKRPFTGTFAIRSLSKLHALVTLQRPLPVIITLRAGRALRSSSSTLLPLRAAAPAAIRPAAPAPTTIRSLFIFAGFLHFLVYLVFLPDLLKFIEIL